MTTSARSKKAVLIGFAEALAGPEVAWSLVDAGYSVFAFTRRGAKPALRRCDDVRLIPVTAPEEDAEQAGRELQQAVAQIGVHAVMPLDDIALWLCDEVGDRLESPVVGPRGDRARIALDKRLQVEAAAAAGLHVPPTLVHASADEVGSESLPVIVKPALAALHRGGRVFRGSGRICGTAEELAAAARDLGNQPVLAQPVLAGDGEGIFGLAGSDGVRVWSAHRRVRMMNPHGSGSSACKAVPVDAGLAAGVESMLTKLGWHGLFMAEFLRDVSGRAWFMELNGRPWGSMALARRMGLEYPAWAVGEAVDPAFELPSVPSREPIVCRHLGRELVHVLMVMRGPRSSAVSHWPSRRKVLRDVFHVSRGDRWYNWRPGARTLFVDDAAMTVLGVVRSRRGA